MNRLVLEKFDDFLDLREAEAIFEALDEFTYTFIANELKCAGDTVGFSSLKEIQEFSDQGYFNKTEGWETGMKLMDWEKTEAFKDLEETVYKHADDDFTKQALEKFKNKFPEKYVAMVLFLTRGKYPKSVASGAERFSPLGKGGGNIFGKKKGKVECHTTEIAEKIIKEDPSKSGENSKSMPFTIPENVNTSGFFVINDWALSDDFKKFLNDNFLSVVKAAVDQAKPLPGKPKAFLDSLDIKTSCSTLPNKKSPDGKIYTFKQLAEKRSESTLKYIKDELEKIGVLVDKDSKISIDSDGENKGKKVGTGYATLTKGQDLTGTSGPEWDGKNTEEIKKFQKVNLAGNVLINTSNAKPPQEQPKDGTVVIPGKNEFRVYASFGKRVLRFSFPSIDIELPKLGIFQKKSRGLRCPKF